MSSPTRTSRFGAGAGVGACTAVERVAVHAGAREQFPALFLVRRPGAPRRRPPWPCLSRCAASTSAGTDQPEGDQRRHPEHRQRAGRLRFGAALLGAGAARRARGASRRRTRPRPRISHSRTTTKTICGQEHIGSPSAKRPAGACEGPPLCARSWRYPGPQARPPRQGAHVVNFLRRISLNRLLLLGGITSESRSAPPRWPSPWAPVRRPNRSRWPRRSTTRSRRRRPKGSRRTSSSPTSCSKARAWPAAAAVAKAAPSSPRAPWSRAARGACGPPRTAASGSSSRTNGRHADHLRRAHPRDLRRRQQHPLPLHAARRTPPQSSRPRRRRPSTTKCRRWRRSKKRSRTSANTPRCRARSRPTSRASPPTPCASRRRKAAASSPAPSCPSTPPTARRCGPPCTRPKAPRRCSNWRPPKSPTGRCRTPCSRSRRRRA